jgi:hypothetical protein
MWDNIILYDYIYIYYTILYDIIRYYTILYDIIQYYTILYNIIRYYTILYALLLLLFPCIFIHTKLESNHPQDGSG